MTSRLASKHARWLCASTSAAAFCAATAYTTVALAESSADQRSPSSSSSSSAAAAANIDPFKPLPDQSRSAFAWGSNRHGVVNPQDQADQLKKPKVLAFLDGLVLRDLALHEQYAGNPSNLFTS